jgi:hypothetical protein
VSELDDLVGEEEAEPEAVAEPEVVAEEAAPAEETTAETASTTGETAGAPPAPKADPVPAHVPVPALLDERAKRQEAEREAKELRAQLAERDAPAPDPINDPAGAFEHLQQSFNQQLTQLNIKQSRMLVMGQKEDFTEREQQFMKLASENPTLVDEMLQADNPALYAYDTAVKHEELAALKDVDGYKAKLRAEVEAEVRAELAKAGETAATETAQAAKAAGIPSLATATESGSGSVPSDDDLSSIVAGHS